ncbi:MAG: hypothetical protein QXE78_10145 [Nitrososphaeria archaeon]
MDEAIIPPKFFLIFSPIVYTIDIVDQINISIKKRDAKSIFPECKESQLANKSAIIEFGKSELSLTFPNIKFIELERCTKKSPLGFRGNRGNAYKYKRRKTK